MVHDLSPFIWRFSETSDFGIRWYGMSYMMGFLCAYFLLRWLVPKQRAGMTLEMVSDFVFYSALGILIGGRVGYVLFYDPKLLASFSSELPFWGALAVNKGGMASHGGMIGLVVSCFLYASRYRLNAKYLFDLVALTGPIGIFFGRIANFINGELVGRPATHDLKWAVRFPQDLYDWYRDEPGKLPDLVTVVDKLKITREEWLGWFEKMRVDASASGNIQRTIHQIIEEIQRGNVEIREALGPLLTPRHPSQIYAALGEGLLLFIILFLYWRRPRIPGLVGALFLMLYSVVRISDEFFRMPDREIGFQLFNLTRGQWLSIGLGLVGVALYFFWAKSPAVPIFGWGQGENIRLNRRSK